MLDAIYLIIYVYSNMNGAGKNIKNLLKTGGAFTAGSVANYLIHNRLNKYSGETENIQNINNELKQARSDIRDISNKVDHVQEQVSNVNDQVTDIAQNCNDIMHSVNDKTKLLPDIDLNVLYSYLDTLSLIQVSNIFHIATYVTILASVVSIIFIFFGNEFISYLNL